MSNPEETGAANAQFPAELFHQFMLAGVSAGLSYHLEKTIEGSIKRTVASEVGTLRGEMKEMFKDVATKADIAAVRGEIGAVRKDMDAAIDGLRKETQAGFKAVDAKMEALQSSLLVKLLGGVAVLLTIAHYLLR